VIVTLLVLGIGAGAVVLFPRSGSTAQARLIGAAEPPDGFARATGPQPFQFPADHGPHPEYQTEWWYYTGNLQTDDGRHFGYQLTFFRRALAPADRQAARGSELAADQVYMAHFALTDASGRDFRAFERFSRGSAGLAGAQSPPYRVWLEDWSVEERAPGTYWLRAAAEGYALDLALVDANGPVLQGDQGYSQKGPEPGNASYYVSQTRLETSGAVTVPGGSFEVSGLSWMDHEYSTSALSAGQVGWDWFSIQLEDGSELMAYQIRRADGSIDPYSKGTFIAPNGDTTLLRAAEDGFTIEVLDTWRSPRSGAEYPSRWRISVPAAGLTLELEPYLADQELDLSFIYWEGAVRASGARNGAPVAGWGYVEMTGYAASMEGQF
jgi:predicted secreted hydrolase